MELINSRISSCVPVFYPFRYRLKHGTAFTQFIAILRLFLGNLVPEGHCIGVVGVNSLPRLSLLMVRDQAVAKSNCLVVTSREFSQRFVMVVSDRCVLRQADNAGQENEQRDTNSFHGLFLPSLA